MQMETEEIAEVEVQRWMNVMLVEEEQNELKDLRARSLRSVSWIQRRSKKQGSKRFSSCRRNDCGTWCRGQKMDAQ